MTHIKVYEKNYLKHFWVHMTYYRSPSCRQNTRRHIRWPWSEQVPEWSLEGPEHARRWRDGHRGHPAVDAVFSGPRAFQRHLLRQARASGQDSPRHHVSSRCSSLEGQNFAFVQHFKQTGLWPLEHRATCVMLLAQNAPPFIFQTRYNGPEVDMRDVLNSITKLQRVVES